MTKLDALLLCLCVWIFPIMLAIIKYINYNIESSYEQELRDELSNMQQKDEEKW